MADAQRGILYIVWGDAVEAQLQRSMASVRRVYPEMPIEIARLPVEQGALRQKAKMAAMTPFATTLYLDTDTIVIGNLDFAFARAEDFALACCICECPWLRRYGHQEGDALEYNTGVMFFTRQARPVFDAWDALADEPSASRFLTLGGAVMGQPYEDQAGFGRATRQTNFHPYVLPGNYNFRPQYQRSFFTPIKIWHDFADIPQNIADLSRATESGQHDVTYVEILPKR